MDKIKELQKEKAKLVALVFQWESKKRSQIKQVDMEKIVARRKRIEKINKILSEYMEIKKLETKLRDAKKALDRNIRKVQSEKDEKCEVYKRGTWKSKKIAAYSKKNELIGVFPSIHDAAQACKVSLTAIKNQINKGGKFRKIRFEQVNKTA